MNLCLSVNGYKQVHVYSTRTVKKLDIDDKIKIDITLFSPVPLYLNSQSAYGPIYPSHKAPEEGFRAHFWKKKFLK